MDNFYYNFISHHTENTTWNYICYICSSVCCFIKPKLHDSAIGNLNHISSSAFETDRIIHGVVSVHPSKNWHPKTIKLQEFLRSFHNQTLISNSFQIPTNVLEGMFVHKLWVECISCSTVKSIIYVRACVSNKKQEHPNNTNHQRQVLPAV